jgi:amino acid transporter
VIFWSTIVVCIVLGQAGQTIKGAYDILVSLTVICTLIPFLSTGSGVIVYAVGRWRRRAGGTIQECVRLAAVSRSKPRWRACGGR